MAAYMLCAYLAISLSLSLPWARLSAVNQIGLHFIPRITTTTTKHRTRERKRERDNMMDRLRVQGSNRCWILSLTDGFTLVVLYACIVVFVGARHVLKPITYTKCTRSGLFYMYASTSVCVYFVQQRILLLILSLL